MVLLCIELERGWCLGIDESIVEFEVGELDFCKL